MRSLVREWLTDEKRGRGMHQRSRDGNGPQQKSVKIGKGKRIAGVDVQSDDQNDKGVVAEY